MASTGEVVSLACCQALEGQTLRRMFTQVGCCALQDMLPALMGYAVRSELEVRKAALLGLEAVGCNAVLLEIGHFQGTVPGLLSCCCDASREVRPHDVLAAGVNSEYLTLLGHRKRYSQISLA